MKKSTSFFKKKYLSVGASILITTTLLVGVILVEGKHQRVVSLSPEVVGEGMAVPACADATRPAGYFDGATCSVLWGWAFDWHRPNEQINIHLYAEGVFRGQFLANISRIDDATVNAVIAGEGNGASSVSHGFVVAMPRSLIDGVAHTLVAYVISSGADNPQIVNTPVVSCVIPAPTNPSHTCASDGASFTASWTAPAGWNSFYWRLHDNTTNTDLFNNSTFFGTSNTVTVTPGHTYSWWVHTRNEAVPAPDWSTAIGETFTCYSSIPGTISLCSGGVCGNPATQANVAHTLAWSCPSGYTTSAGVGFSTGGALNGSVTVTPANTTTYEIHCNPGNTVTSITATVVTPQLSLAAQAPRVNTGQSASLVWSASDVTSCVLASPAGTALASVTASGGVISSRATATGAVTGKSTFTLTCQTAVGPRSVSVDVGLIPKVIEI